MRSLRTLTALSCILDCPSETSLIQRGWFSGLNPFLFDTTVFLWDDSEAALTKFVDFSECQCQRFSLNSVWFQHFPEGQRPEPECIGHFDMQIHNHFYWYSLIPIPYQYIYLGSLRQTAKYQEIASYNVWIQPLIRWVTTDVANFVVFISTVCKMT